MPNVTLEVTLKNGSLDVDQSGNGNQIAHGQSVTITSNRPAGPRPPRGRPLPGRPLPAGMTLAMATMATTVTWSPSRSESSGVSSPRV